MMENDSGKKLARPFPPFIFLSGYCFLYIEYNLAGEVKLERMRMGYKWKALKQSTLASK
jgi:hypothetical protein